MTPAEHVHVAMMTCHPMQLQPTLGPPVGYATRHGATDDEICMRQRNSMLVLIRKMAKTLMAERDLIIGQCNPAVKAILTQNAHIRHVPLQRELGFATKPLDGGAIPSLVSGLPMVGHAVWVPEMMIRSKPFVFTIDEVIQKSKSNNLKMISQAKSTGGVKLDELA